MHRRMGSMECTAAEGCSATLLDMSLEQGQNYACSISVPSLSCLMEVRGWTTWKIAGPLSLLNWWRFLLLVWNVIAIEYSWAGSTMGFNGASTMRRLNVDGKWWSMTSRVPADVSSVGKFAMVFAITFCNSSIQGSAACKTIISGPDSEPLWSL